MKVIKDLLSSPAFWVIALALILAGVANWGTERGVSSSGWASETNSEEEKAGSNSKEELLREGTQLKDVRGKFRAAADRFIFVEEGTNRSWTCLENLWLQRIAASQKSEDRKVSWLISAKFYEFEGENYLQVEIASKVR